MYYYIINYVYYNTKSKSNPKEKKITEKINRRALNENKI